jgi:hypothetical protein
MILTILIAFVMLFALTVPGWAEEKPLEKAKGPSCPDQLAQLSVQANNLATDRAQKEQALAKEQLASYLLRQQVAQLQKQLAEKPQESK